MPIVDVGGCAIRFETWGDGEPVVLLHGFTSSIDQNWVDRSWVEGLATAGHRLVGVDLRGHGQSSKLYRAEGYETSLLASDVVHVLDELRVRRSDVLGFPMGAGVAIRRAIDSPERVRRLVLCGIGDAAIRGHHSPAEIEEITRLLPPRIPSAWLAARTAGSSGRWARRRFAFNQPAMLDTAVRRRMRRAG